MRCLSPSEGDSAPGIPTTALGNLRGSPTRNPNPPSPASAVVVLAADEAPHLPRVEVVLAAFEANEVGTVHVHLDGGAVAEVVERVDVAGISGRSSDTSPGRMSTVRSRSSRA